MRVRPGHLVRATRGLAAGVAVFALAGCGDDEAVTAPVVMSPTSLHYDAANQSAPSLAAGVYEAGARFTSSQIADRVGRKLTEVRFYIHTPAEVCSVKVYGPSTTTTPGAPLYVADVTSEVQAQQWNVHALTQPVTLTSADLWICLHFSNAVSQPTLGCDPGPAVQDGDWLYAAADGTWKPLSQRFPVSINWNVRGTISAH